jgi:6-methylsalicylate decarboxylase
VTGRIDTHSHFVPPEYLDWLHSQPNFPGPFIEWNREAALDFYDQNGIAAGILSISSPGVHLGAGQAADETRRVARMVNDSAAEVVRSAPTRFGFFATLTLPDVDGAIAEAAYALDELGADGVVLMTNTDGAYLGAPEFDPLFAFLSDRECVVFVHPTIPAGARAAGLSPGVVDFVADTVRCATSLAMSGTLARHPNLRVILSHGGGFLPYTALRIANMVFPGRDPNEGVEEFRRFYFDTALASSVYSLPALTAFAQPDHVTFGTDWPYANTAQASAFTAELDSRGLAPDVASAINFANAKQLFPRLAAAKG